MSKKNESHEKQPEATPLPPADSTLATNEAGPLPKYQPAKQAPTIGRLLQYVLTEQDAKAINLRRAACRDWARVVRGWPDGVAVFSGNTAEAGQAFPLLVTRVFGTDGKVNGQVLLDGNDSHWVTSAIEGFEPGTWSWPVRS